MMAIDIETGADGVLTVSPTQNIVPVEIFMDPARGSPLVKSGDARNIHIGQVLIVGCSRVGSNCSNQGHASLLTNLGEKGTSPVDLCIQSGVGNNYAVDRTGIGTANWSE